MRSIPGGDEADAGFWDGTLLCIEGSGKVSLIKCIYLTRDLKALSSACIWKKNIPGRGLGGVGRGASCAEAPGRTGLGRRV